MNLRTGTDWALAEFRTHYGDDTITKWDIFHYTYGLLHHPDYREKYQANLKRDLPHIPFAEDFWGFANAGSALADLHVTYESVPKYDELKYIKTPRLPQYIVDLIARVITVSLKTVEVVGKLPAL